MTNKWTKQDKDNGIYPAIGDIVKAVLGLHDEVEINVRGYSIDDKIVFGQDVKSQKNPPSADFSLHYTNNV